MSKPVYKIDRTNNRIVEIIQSVKEDWVKVKDPISNEIYLQKKLLLKEAN